MKKFFAVFAIAATMVACNDSSESTTTTDTTTTVDTNTIVSPPTPVDTTIKVADTTIKPVDTTKK